MNQRRSSSAARVEAFRHHPHDRIEVRPRKRAIRPGPPHEREEFVFVIFAARSFGDNLLGQDVERRVVAQNGIELSVSNRSKERCALHQIVSRRWKDAPLGNARHRMSGTSNALEQCGDSMRRADLADQVDVADVDSQFERGGRDERPQRPALQSCLGVQPLLFRKAAVMCRDRLLAQAFAEMPRETLRHPAGIYEDERCAMGIDQCGQAVVVLLPDFLRHHRIQGRARDFDSQIHPAAMSDIDHRTILRGSAGAEQEPRDFFDRFLGRGKPEAQQPPLGNLLQPFERERQVGATPRADDRVDFVDDHGASRPQHVPAAVGREQEI